MATLIPVAVNPTGPGFAQATAADTISIPGGFALPGLTPGSVIFAGAGGALSQDNANLFWDDTNNALGVGTAAPGVNTVSVVQPVKTSGSPTALRVAGGAHTTLTASVEAPDVSLALARTVQFATGALAAQRAVLIDRPKYAFVGASVVTECATVAIVGAPSAHTNATFTQSSALYIGANDTTDAGAVTRSYGVYCNSQTGATNNYAAVFMGGSTGVGLNNPHAQLEVSLPAGSGGHVDTMFITTGARTGVDADTEINTLLITTGTRQWNQGGAAFALQREVGITQPSYSFTVGDTISLAATFHVGGAPAAGANATLTATHGIYVAAAAVGAGATAAYGLTVNAPTGGVANYAAAFLGGNVGIGTATPDAGHVLTITTTGAVSPLLGQGPGALYVRLISANVAAADNSGGYSVKTLTTNQEWSWVKRTGDAGWGVRAHGLEVQYYNGASWLDMFSCSATGNFGINMPTATAQLHVVQRVATSGSPNALLIVGGAHTTLAIAEASDVYFNLARTVQFSNVSPTIALQRAVCVSAPTYTAAAGMTITEAATLGLSGAPVKGVNVTVTRSSALLISAGAVSTATASYGIYCNAQTGGTANYAAAFMGGNVGIGTATPTNNLMVSGSGASYYPLGLTNTDAKQTGFSITNSNSQWLVGIDLTNSGDQGFFIHDNTAGVALTRVNITHAGNFGINVTPTAQFHVVQPVVTAGSPNAMLIVGGAHTTLAIAEASDVYFNLARTVSFSNAGGVIAAQRAVYVSAPTYAAAAAMTITEAATLSLSGAPVKGANVTVTRSSALLISAGAVSTVNDSYGIYCNAQTGGVANYAAAFMGGNVGIMTIAPTAYLAISPTAIVNGLTALRVSSGIHSATTAATEVPQVLLECGGREWTAGAAITAQRAIKITAAAAHFTGGSTITDAATVGITGAYIAATNATITRSHGLWIESNAVLTGVACTAAYGLTVSAPTGAVDNFAGHFIGASGAAAVVLYVEETAAAAGAVSALAVIGAAKTLQTISAEIPFATFVTSSRQWTSGGDVAFQREFKITQPTYSFSAAGQNITDAATLSVEGAPRSDTGATIVASHGIYVKTADVTAAGACTASYGLTVNAMTGGTANYAAAFLGGNVGFGTPTPTYLITTNAGVSPAIAVLINIPALAGPGDALLDSSVVSIRSRSYESGVSAHYGMIHLDALAQTYAGQATFRVRDAIDTDTLASSYNLLAIGRPTATLVTVLINDGTREGDTCYVMPAAKLSGTKNGDDLHVSGGDSIGADHVPGSLYLDCGALGTGSTTITSVHVGTLYAGEIVNIAKSDGLLGFFGTAAVVRNGTPFTLNSGGMSWDLPAAPTAQQAADCLRQLLDYLGDVNGMGLANVTA